MRTRDHGRSAGDGQRRRDDADAAHGAAATRAAVHDGPTPRAAFAPLVLAGALAACHVRAPAAPGADIEITLYRDAALVRQRVELELPATPTTVTVEVPAGVDRVTVIDRGGLAVAAVHVPLSKPALTAGGEPAAPPTTPTRVALDVAAPRAGRYALAIAYVTDRLAWTAAYTMTTTPARDRATLHGALAVTNTSALPFPRAALRVVDASFGEARARASDQLATDLAGGVASTTPTARPHDLGVVALVRGETRVELAGLAAPRAMRSVLVYDPIGTALDNPNAVPTRDASIGVSPPAPTQVSESFEVDRDARATADLPAGPVKLYEREPGGALALLGEAQLFGDATRVALVDTIPVGTAAGVVAHRERRELTIEDDVRHRLTEEFVITVDNARDRPVDVLVREHLYRGQTWIIAYESTKRPAKEGAQQIALRTDVPAKAEAEITYVVVYSWKP